MTEQPDSSAESNLELRRWDGLALLAWAAAILAARLLAVTVFPPGQGALGLTVISAALPPLLALLAVCLPAVKFFGWQKYLELNPERPRPVWRRALAAAGTGLFLFIAVIAVNLLLQLLLPGGFPGDRLIRLLREGSTLYCGLIVLSALVISPLSEELVFRLLLPRWLRGHGVSRNAAWAIAGCGFALAHSNPAGFPAYFLIALVLSLTQARCGLAAAIAAHAIFNACNLAAVFST